MLMSVSIEIGAPNAALSNWNRDSLNSGLGSEKTFLVIESLVFCAEFFVNVYEFHDARILAESCFCFKCIITESASKSKKSTAR